MTAGPLHIRTQSFFLVSHVSFIPTASSSPEKYINCGFRSLIFERGAKWSLRPPSFLISAVRLRRKFFYLSGMQVLLARSSHRMNDDGAEGRMEDWKIGVEYVGMQVHGRACSAKLKGRMRRRHAVLMAAAHGPSLAGLGTGASYSVETFESFRILFICW